MQLNLATKEQLDHPKVRLPGARHGRYARRYDWADICFDSDKASKVDRKSGAFRSGMAWYAAFRWAFGHRNVFLDQLLDEGKLQPRRISRKEYQRYYRIWIKRLLLAGW
ncbi:MAG: hypothetical protein R8K46_03575 [Mariprofundaceae bacterium]